MTTQEKISAAIRAGQRFNSAIAELETEDGRQMCKDVRKMIVYLTAELRSEQAFKGKSKGLM